MFIVIAALRGGGCASENNPLGKVAKLSTSGKIMHMNNTTTPNPTIATGDFVKNRITGANGYAHYVSQINDYAEIRVNGTTARGFASDWERR